MRYSQTNVFLLELKQNWLHKCLFVLFTYFSTKSPEFSPWIFPFTSSSFFSIPSSVERRPRDVQKCFSKTGTPIFKQLDSLFTNWFCRKWAIGKFRPGFRMKGRMLRIEILSKNTKKIFITYFYPCISCFHHPSFFTARRKRIWIWF